MKTVWAVGNIISNDGKEWELQGIFEKKEDAKEYGWELCHHPTEPHIFVAPVELNSKIPLKRTEWPGLIFLDVETKT